MSYALIQIDPFKIVQELAGDYPPAAVVWPNGNATHGVTEGFVHDRWMLAKVVYDERGGGEFHRVKSSTPSLDGTCVTYIREWEPDDLDLVKDTLKGRVDAAAEQARQLLVTPGSSQAMVYQSKADEAARALADRNPPPGRYPLLDASVGIDGETITEVAKVVTRKATELAKPLADIERVRLTAKAAITAAPDVQTAMKVCASLKWPPAARVSG